MQKGIGTIHILIILGLLVLAGSIGYVYYGQQKNIGPQPVESGRQTTVPQPSPLPPQSDETTNWKTYRNDNLGFSFQYPHEWDVMVKENDLRLGSLVSFKFTTGQTWGIDRDEFLGLVGCFAGMSNVDPFYLGDFLTTEPIKIDGVATSIYYDQNRGLETLKFYIPLIKQDSKRCGIFFQSFGNFTKLKKDIITSLDFTNGFEAFVNAVAKQFQVKLPTKG